MKKGEESRQRLIECAAELFWKNGYSATGISEILKQTDLPKGSFYFYFKSKDDLATAVTEYYQKILLEQFQNSSAAHSIRRCLDSSPFFNSHFLLQSGKQMCKCKHKRFIMHVI